MCPLRADGSENDGPVPQQGGPFQGILPLRLSPPPGPLPRVLVTNVVGSSSGRFPCLCMRSEEAPPGSEVCLGWCLTLGLLGLLFPGALNRRSSGMAGLQGPCRDTGVSRLLPDASGPRSLCLSSGAQHPLLAAPWNKSTPPPPQQASGLQPFLGDSRRILSGLCSPVTACGFPRARSWDVLHLCPGSRGRSSRSQAAAFLGPLLALSPPALPLSCLEAWVGRIPS